MLILWIAYVDLEPALTGFNEKRKVALNSADTLFGELRDMNFSTVASYLNRTARRINENYEVGCFKLEDILLLLFEKSKFISTQPQPPTP